MLSVICPAVVIADGSNISGAVPARWVYEDADYISLFGGDDAAADGAIEVSPDYDPNDSSVTPTWFAVQDDAGNPILAPGAGEALRISTAYLGQAFRINSTVGASGADATWAMNKRMISVGA